jgi:hypothetical protein
MLPLCPVNRFEVIPCLPFILLIHSVSISAQSATQYVPSGRGDHVYLQFAGLLLVIFGMELAGGITGYVLKDDVEGVLRNTVNNSMYKYPYNKEITKTWDIMQHDVSTV